MTKNPTTMLKIKVISEETIKPSNPTPNHLRYLQSSLIDHVNVPILMPFIFFYSPKNHKDISNSIFLANLKKSISTTLSIFYPLAGRVQNSSYITCNDEGVPYVETHVGSFRLKDIVHKLSVSQLDQLMLPSFGQEGYSDLLLAIQVNVFACGGVGIGIKCSHAIFDGFSVAMFMTTWAAIARGADYNTLGHPNFEIWKVFPPLPLPPPTPQHVKDTAVKTSSQPYPDLVKIKMVTKWFIFSNAKLVALRSKLNSDDLPSLSMVLSAFIWSRYNIACNGNNNNTTNIPHEMNHAVNLRPKVTSPSKNSYYFGNLYVNAIAKIPTPTNDTLNNTSLLCNNFLERTKMSLDEILNDDFVKKMQEGKEDLSFLKEYFDKKDKGEIMSLGFSNLRSFIKCQPDFGLGKPVWMTSGTLPFKNAVSLVPGGSSINDDIIAFINLSVEEMDRFECDEEFLRFVSKAACGRSKL